MDDRKLFPRAPEPLFPEAEVLVQEIKDHGVNIVQIFTVGLHDLPVDLNVHGAPLFCGQISAVDRALVLLNSHGVRPRRAQTHPGYPQ